MKRVIGIGNALTDMLVNLRSDSVLSRYNLPKGSMSLVDARLQTEISKSVAGLPYSLSLGGSAGNTIRAMARLGCDVGFIGKVGKDTTGDFFVQALENLGVEPFIFRGSERSGKCVSLISPDGERTMITHRRGDRPRNFPAVRLPLCRRLSGTRPCADRKGRPDGQGVRPAGRHRSGELQHRGREPFVPAKLGSPIRRHPLRQ